MAATDNIAFAVTAWVIAACCSVAAAVISRRDKSWVDLLAVGFLSGCVAFAVIRYYVRNGSGVAGSEWYYLSWSVPIGAFTYNVYGFVSKRADQILKIVLARFGLTDVGENQKHSDGSGADSGSVNHPASTDSVEDRP